MRVAGRGERGAQAQPSRLSHTLVRSRRPSTVWLTTATTTGVMLLRNFSIATRMYWYCALPAASVSAWHTPTGATLRYRNSRVIVARWRGANSPSAAAPCASAEQSSSPNDESISGYGKPTRAPRISLFRIISAGPTRR